MKSSGDFPSKIGAPARRALQNVKIANLAALAKCTEAEVLALHGMGPKAMGLLKLAMKKQKLDFVKKHPIAGNK